MCAGYTLAYTSVMRRLILALLGLPSILATAAIAQLKITVPVQHYWVQDEIHAKVENTSSQFWISNQQGARSKE